MTIACVCAGILEAAALAGVVTTAALAAGRRRKKMPLPPEPPSGPAGHPRSPPAMGSRRVGDHVYQVLPVRGNPPEGGPPEDSFLEFHRFFAEPGGGSLQVRRRARAFDLTNR